MDKPLFVLASKSPRRKELLQKIGINAQIIPASIDEGAYKNLSPEKMVTQLAMLKAADVARSMRKNIFVIGADTCVCLDGRILGKPNSIEDAENMLKMLSGKTHQVYTGYSVINCADGSAISRYCTTDVTFRELAEREIKAYVKSREPMDKAGAYGIQGKGALFVKKINGDYSNVVGLPVCELAQLLSEEFSVEII